MRNSMIILKKNKTKIIASLRFKRTGYDDCKSRAGYFHGNGKSRTDKWSKVRHFEEK